MITKMQALMTDWCGCIRATGGFIAPTKTRWFLVSSFWNGNDYEYETKDSLPGLITLPDKDGQLYTVNREEPTKAFKFLDLRIDLAGTSTTALDDVTDEYQEFATQITNAKCDKTSCLNAFNTSFIPTLAYKIIATQFTEQQWNKTIYSAIRATCNTTGLEKSFPHAVLYGPLIYQDIGVKNPFFLQSIIHIITFLNEAACNLSTGVILRSNTEYFEVEIGIPFSLTKTVYNKKTYASYMPSGWYKKLWKFISTPLYKLNITEDYNDLPLLQKKDEYLMMTFVKGGFRNADLKALNYIRKFLKAITLADIATADGSRITFQSYIIIEGNHLRLGNKEWPKTLTKDEMPACFTTLLQFALNKCLCSNSSHLARQITKGKQLGGLLDQDVKRKWKWWSVPNKDRFYIQNSWN